MLRERGHQALAVMEQTLGQTAFLTGDTATVADIALYAYTHVAGEGGFDLSAYPGIRQWMKRLQAFPGWLPMAEACK